MEEVFGAIDRLRTTERRFAMATLVATRGTTPKKEGAKMWVGEGGRILGSVTIGGCVDARVIEESESVLREGHPRLLSIPMGDEDAWELGLTCGGTVDVFIEPVNADNPADLTLRIYDAVRTEVQRDRHAVIATLLAEPWSKVVVRQDGTLEGTLGEADLDEQVRTAALALMKRQLSRTLRLRETPKPIDVFFEWHGPPPTLIVFGAVHLAIPLVAMAKILGLRTVVVDSRPRFANRERFPEADEIIVGIPSEVAERLTYTPSTFVVLVAHDYKYEIPILRTVLKTDAAYIGMLGNPRRGQAVLDILARRGVDREALARVHVPIGLDIGAQTASEIALSILAEALAVRNDRSGLPLKVRRGMTADAS